MGHSNVRTKVRRRKVAALAAYSRQFTVKNITSTISPVVKHERHSGKIDEKMVITNPLTGNKFMQTNPHTITGNYGASITAYDWVPLEEFKKSNGKLWIIPDGGFKQPKRLIKCKKTRRHSKSNDFIAYFPKYPYTIKPMSKEAYMEKLVAHKLEKWEKTHPKPEDMFVEDVEKWNNERFVAEQRFRDFVISVYYKMKVFATVTKPGGPPFKEIPIGEVAGGKNAIEEATKIAKEAKAKDINILHCQVYEPNGKYRLVA